MSSGKYYFGSTPLCGDLADLAPVAIGQKRPGVASQIAVQSEAGRKLTKIYVDGDACPVRERIYRVAARL
jgi:hypothetical protein